MYNFSERLAAMKGLGLEDVKVVYANDGGKSGLLSDSEMEVRNDAGLLAICDSHRQIPFGLIVSIKRDYPVYVVWAEGAEREIRTLGDKTRDNDDVATFVKRIPTSLTRSGEYATKNNGFECNGVWFISVAGGKLRMWEIAIVTAIGGGYSRYYLSLQEVYAAAMFGCTIGEWDDPVYIPEEQFPNYMNWLSLRLFLAGTVDISTLEPFSEYRPLEKEPVVLTDGQAEVIWFNQAKGFGFARVNGEELDPNFHRSQVKDQEFPAFQPGQVIRYESLNRTPRGVQLMGVTE